MIGFTVCVSYLVSRSKTCCLRLGIVVRASTIVQAACLAAWVAGVKRTCNRWNWVTNLILSGCINIYVKWQAPKNCYFWVLILLLAPNLISNKDIHVTVRLFFLTCRSQLLWLSFSRRGKRPSPFLDLMNCFHFQAYFSSRYCFLNSAFPWGFDTLSWPRVR